MVVVLRVLKLKNNWILSSDAYGLHVVLVGFEVIQAIPSQLVYFAWGFPG